MSTVAHLSLLECLCTWAGKAEYLVVWTVFIDLPLTEA